jgi:hypothetical protein
MSRSGAIHVVATVNLTKASGHLQHVTAYETAPPGASVLAASRARRSSTGPTLSLRVYCRGSVPQEFPAAFIQDACKDPGEDVTGTVDALLPAAKDGSRLELVLNGHVIDTYEAGARARAYATSAAPLPRDEPPGRRDRDRPLPTLAQCQWQAATPVRRPVRERSSAAGRALHGR